MFCNNERLTTHLIDLAIKADQHKQHDANDACFKQRLLKFDFRFWLQIMMRPDSVAAWGDWTVAHKRASQRRR